MKLSELRSPFKWGSKSRRLLASLHDDLYFALNLLLAYYSTADISVIQTARTEKEHQDNLKTGKSHVKVSRHLLRYSKTKPKYPRSKKINTGMVSHAVDIAPFIKGKASFKAEDYYALAEQMRIIAIKFDLPIRWGGCWQDLRKVKSVKTAVDKYVLSCEKKGKKPFLDLGHFELSKSAYPGTLKP